MYYRMNYVYEKIYDQISEHFIEEFEKIDELLCKSMDYAESKCRKLCMGTIPWSPSYKRIDMEMKYWRMRKSYKLGLHRNVRQLLVLQNKLKIKYVSSMRLTMIEYRIRMVYVERKKIIKIANECGRNCR